MAPHAPVPRPTTLPDPTEKSRKKWIIAIVAAAVVLLVLLITFGALWLLGGDSQGARSACTKAATDLTKKYETLQDSVKKAEELLQNTDATTLTDPQLLSDLKLKTQQAGKAITPLACDSTMKQEQLAKNASEMLATTEKLSAQLDDLDRAIASLRDSQNIKDLGEVKTELENTVKSGDDLMKQLEKEKLDDTEALAALQAQLDDAKRLLDQVNSLKSASEDKVSDLSESMRAAQTRLQEDMDAVKKAAAKKREEKARQDAEDKKKQEEQERLEREREASEKARTHTPSPSTTEGADGDYEGQPDGTANKKPPACAVGSTMTDPNGGKWQCANTLDPTTGTSAPSWVQETPATTPAN
ncbi:hypothetical protein HMPREF0580_0242 [Mobiluncus mulieris ATCC 35239]|uniref:Uncharacterized protein n=3 Tax=Mobiluncus mulieris TaxID=2052 RepID=E0QMX8_9ACTO|nr:hypothetical protein HMPREF0577_1879 [Mobiluncus mulieris ATCC 35243]EFM47145.1 hypothetical protein HMPREF0580_0242 [Mobiluncus mulieris ATCC 35239]MCU9975749.1 hypothetical protein [Mobiluncus mulieris]MCU9996096.1 hypothetical protein [Mobiluncus mulieris]MCV0002330.1 hypothetical protein [Mobiluncus mulieris]